MTYKELREKRLEHRTRVASLRLKDSKGEQEIVKCLHQLCEECWGTGTKLDGEMCIHTFSCVCDRCFVIGEERCN